MGRVNLLRVYQKSIANFKAIVKGYQAVFISHIASIKGKLQTRNEEVLLSIQRQGIMNTETKV